MSHLEPKQLLRLILNSVLGSFLLTVPLKAQTRLERTVYAMGTELRVAVVAVDRAAALATSERAIAAVEEVEARLSTWRSDSELSRLNRSTAARWAPISPALAAELAAARWCWLATGGAFDPTVGALVEAWGLRDGGRQPSAAQLRAAVAATGLEGLDLRPSAARPFAARPSAARRRHAALRLEEGGFGKGAGLAAALATLQHDDRLVAVELDFGGQLTRWGAGGVWRLQVSHPGQRQLPLVELRLDGGSVATSGNSERGLLIDGERRSHLLDPRTGQPAESFGSLTVWTEDPLRADCLSTGLFVMGPDAALRWASGQAGIEVLVLEENEKGLRLRATAGLRGRIRPRVENLEMSVEFTDLKNRRAAVPEGQFEGPPALANQRRREPAPSSRRSIHAQQWIE